MLPGRRHTGVGGLAVECLCLGRVAGQAAHQSNVSGWVLLAVLAFAAYVAWKIRKWRKNRKG